MVIVIHSLYPAITGFDRVATSVTLGGEQFIPIYFDFKFSFKLLIQFLKRKTNQLRSKEGHPQDKSDYCRKVIRSKYKRSTRDGIAYQWHSNNPVLHL